jgi:hypothetical protein
LAKRQIDQKSKNNSQKDRTTKTIKRQKDRQTNTNNKPAHKGIAATDGKFMTIPAKLGGR